MDNNDDVPTCRSAQQQVAMGVVRGTATLETNGKKNARRKSGRYIYIVVLQEKSTITMSDEPTFQKK